TMGYTTGGSIFDRIGNAKKKLLDEHNINLKELVMTEGRIHYNEYNKKFTPDLFLDRILGITDELDYMKRANSGLNNLTNPLDLYLHRGKTLRESVFTQRRSFQSPNTYGLYNPLNIRTGSPAQMELAA